MTNVKPIYPGEILREEFIVPFGFNPNKLASRSELLLLRSTR